jgi:predicted KAP-like P-loop ATPase
MWADVDTRSDFLNYSEVADLAIDVVRNPRMRPVSVGVFGSWGVGKSTILNLVEQGLEAPDEKGKFIVVRFDAWLYQGFDDSRAALMEVIASTLMDAAKSNESTKDKAKKLIRRVNVMRFLGLAAEGGAAAMGFPTFGLLNKGISALSDMLSDEPDDEDYKTLTDAGADVVKRTKGLLNPESVRTPPKEIAAFRSEFGDLVTELDKTLVVFVDNLDRCLPKQTIHTLEALRLFLFMDRTAFLIAADEEMVRHSVAEFFKEPDGRHVIDYLDKLIQVPIRVPRLGVQEVRAYLFLLFAVASDDVPAESLEALRVGLETSLRQSWKDEPITTEDALRLLGDAPPIEVTQGFAIADRIAPLLANSAVVEGNPRIVKRMLNVIRMRSRLARRRQMPFDEALIAKLALFERCTDAASIAYLYSSINEAANGKPAILEKLEELREDPGKFKDACPEPWAARVDFVREWVSLEPLLGGRDLRPAVYLSRETVPLRAVRGGLSAPAAEGLRVLLRAASTSSPSGKSALAAIPATEHSLVMASMVSEFRKHAAWNTKPSGFDGALMLAAASSEAGALLAGCIRTVVPGRLPPWLNVLVKDAAWFKVVDKR